MKLYKTKMVKPIELPSREGHETAPERAGCNAFNLGVRDVYIDLLINSGVGTTSAEQWVAITRGDEAYAGSESFARLMEPVRGVVGLKHVVPTHQDRDTEDVLYGVLLEDGDIMPNNSHFDTTRAHVANQGAEPVDYPSPAARDPNLTETFKGNFDIDADYALVEEIGADTIPVVVLAIMDNSVAGQPVSMMNICATVEFARDIDTIFVVDARRSAENAHFTRIHETGYENHSVAETVRARFEHADAITISGKRDASVNIGGFATMRDGTMFEHTKRRATPYRGFPTYGDLSGRGIEAMAVGLREAVVPPYMTDHAEQVVELGDPLAEADVPVYQSTGGHAVCLDAGEASPYIPKEEFPGQELVCAPYLEGGVRGVELGGSVFPGIDQPDLVRLAFPRRTCNREYLERITETAAKVVALVGEYGGLEVVVEPSMEEL